MACGGGDGRGQDSCPGSQDLPLLFPVPPSSGTASSLHAALLGLPRDPSLPHSLWGLPYPAAPAPLGTHSTPHSEAIRPCLIHSLHPSTQAPTPAPCLPPHSSLPVLISLIHLPLSKIHPPLPSPSHIETKTHRPRNRLTGRHRTPSCHRGTHTRTLAPTARGERGTQRRHLSAHARKHPHPQPPPCPHKGADTLGGRDKGAHICGRRGTPPPGTPTTAARAMEASSGPGLPPFLPANVSLLGLPGL